MNFESEFANRAKVVEAFLVQTMQNMDLPGSDGISYLKSSMAYSLEAGGKRFRPVLSLIVAEMFDVSSKQILPFASAVEMIHTYSLIHDDLPAMDNDDFRRGLPTNHKKFGEAFALLAGDALLTEAFLVPARDYASDPALAIKLVELLSRASGARGMVGGQAIDLFSEKEKSSKKLQLNEILNLHHLKTGRLIQLAIEGAAWIAKLDLSDIQTLRNFGEHLGLAFQVTDDILDKDRSDEAHKSFVGLLGLEETKNLLNQVSAQALNELRTLSKPAKLLEAMIEYNRTRGI